MNQTERRRFLLDALRRENPSRSGFALPASAQEQARLLRALMNVRPPEPVSAEFLAVQDAYLRQQRDEKGVVTLEQLTPVQPGLYLWQGDITRLRVDAIVNAANSALLGCFIPCHGCIDNAIHSAAGVELRLACAELMARQGFEEPAGQAKITPAFNLPSRWVLHTVGPIVQGAPTAQDRALLAGCYRSCLTLAAAQGTKSIAFCCISTGEFHFPNRQAAQIAVQAVRTYQNEHPGEMEVVFNVFKDLDQNIYAELLGAA